MKKYFLFALFLTSIFAVGAHAQEEEFNSTRLNTYANDLKRGTVDLVDRTSENLRRSSTNPRAAIEEAFLAHQIDAGAGLFQQMLGDRRRGAELRDAAAILTDLARRAPTTGANGSLWRDVQDSINNINRELGNAGGTGGGGNAETRPVIGRVFWRGTVDHHIVLVIRESTIETRLLSGKAYPEGIFSFTTPLPNRSVSVEVTKTKGRGIVRITQQPSKENDFTALVEIMDTDGGAKEYQLDIFWR